MTEIKTGFIPDTPDERDFVFGAKGLETKFAGRTIINESGDWSNWLPTTEHQAEKYETNSCVSFGSLNVVEILRKHSENIDENLSDRFVARISGTDPYGGNSPRTVANAIKKYWSVKEPEYPRPDTLEEFYSNIPEKIRSLAIGRGAYYDYGYEKVKHSDMREALKYSPLGISVPAWFMDSSNRYHRPEGQRDTHWCVCYAIQPTGDLMVFDSYYPYLKQIKADVVPEVIYSYYLRRQVKNQSAWQTFLNWLYLSLAGFGKRLIP